MWAFLHGFCWFILFRLKALLRETKPKQNAANVNDSFVDSDKSKTVTGLKILYFELQTATHTHMPTSGKSKVGLSLIQSRQFPVQWNNAATTRVILSANLTPLTQWLVYTHLSYTYTHGRLSFTVNQGLIPPEYYPQSSHQSWGALQTSLHPSERSIKLTWKGRISYPLSLLHTFSSSLHLFSPFYRSSGLWEVCWGGCWRFAVILQWVKGVSSRSRSEIQSFLFFSQTIVIVHHTQ